MKSVTDGFCAARTQAIQADGDETLQHRIESDVYDRFPVGLLAVDSQKVVTQHPLGIRAFSNGLAPHRACNDPNPDQLIQQIAGERRLLNARTGLRP